MRTHRLYVEVDLAEGETVELAPEAARHLRQVLRLKAGDALVVFNGRGGEFEARLGGPGRSAPRIEVGGFRDVDRESPLGIHLGQAIAKGDNMDYALEKATELGVGEITPIAAQRSVVKLDAERAHKRHAHWRRVIIGACEQCGRTRLPVLHPPQGLETWLDRTRADVALVLHPGAERSDGALAAEAASVAVLVGPEGGFEPEELARACAASFTPLRLGPRVLRTETAAGAALALIQLRWGDLRGA